jgi:hypothetical protein
MAIFSRRTIQQMINGNAAFLTEEQIDKHIFRLDSNSFESIATEWEVVVLNVFSKIGHVEHEPNLGTSRKLDLRFTHYGDQSQFVADIATVSDEGYEDETPLKAFDIEFRHHIKRAGLAFCDFGYSVKPQPPTDAKTRLILPKQKYFSEEIFNKQFKTFLWEVKHNLGEARSHHILTDKTNIVITYDPEKKASRGAGYVYTLAISKTQNPVYNALRSKQRQLRQIEFSGAKGIIVCDGGSHMFNAKASGEYRPYFNAAEVINEFLRQNQSINFVLAISVIFTNRGRTKINAKRPMRKVKVELFPNRRFVSLSEKLRNRIAEIERYFPEPFNIPDGERETIRQGFRPKEAWPLLDYLSVSDSEIRLWANNLFALLEGAVTQDKFFELSRFKDCYFGSTHVSNPFEHFHRLKKRIVEVRIEEEHDFTYLVFKFDGPDPATSDFSNPKKGNSWDTVLNW